MDRAMAAEPALDALGLTRLYYANYSEMWRAVGAATPDRRVFDVEQRADMLVVRSVLTARIPHMILRPTVASSGVDQWIARLVDELGSGPPSLLVYLAPGEEHLPLAGALQREGFRPTSRSLVAMALQGVQDLPPPAGEPPCDLARTAGDLQAARLLLSTVFGLPLEVFAFYTPSSLVRTYIMRRRGAIVAALCLYLSGATAGVYSVAVMPSERRRGLATTLVRCALADVARDGIMTAVLSCERGLVPWYERLRFQVSRSLVQYWFDPWWR
jgi:GNAT superfamily N-acetyltransferase